MKSSESLVEVYTGITSKNFVSMPNVPHNSKEIIPFTINIINKNIK